MTAQRKINCIHVVATVTLAITLALDARLDLFIAGLVIGWMLWLIGVSLSLHKWSAHRSWCPRRRLIKILLLWLGTCCCLESAMSWRNAHRLHHRHSDTPADRFSATGWQAIKIGLYYHLPPVVHVRLNEWRLRPLHRWFHRHYFQVLTVTATAIIAAAGANAAYFISLPILYVLCGYFWITVIAHHHGQPHDHPIAEFLFPGEGHHAAHHRHPGLPNPGHFDLTSPIIAILTRA